jgi:hypothetical protein
MRLLKIEAGGEFSLTRIFRGLEIPCYAILSHIWEPDDQEVTLQDLLNGVGSNKSGYKKIKFAEI